MWNWWYLRSFRDHRADEEQLLAMCKEFLHLRCCPTVTWLSSLLSFLCFIGIMKMFSLWIIYYSAGLALQGCLTRMKFKVKICTYRKFGKCKKKEIFLFFRIVMMLNNSAFGFDLGICCLQPATNLWKCPTLLFELRVTKVGLNYGQLHTAHSHRETSLSTS